MAAEKQTYVVTEAAGLYVAGKRVREGQELALTESQAAYELARGVIKLRDEAKAADAPANQPAVADTPEPAAELPSEGWRPVKEGEILPAGSHVRMNVTTGTQEVYDPEAATASVDASAKPA